MTEDALRFSVTDIKNANRCPRLFILNKKYQKKIMRYSGMVIGSLVHNTIDKLIAHMKSGDSFKTQLQQKPTADQLLNQLNQELYKFYLGQILESKDQFGRTLELEIISKSFNRGWNLLQRAAEVIRDILYPALSRMSFEEAIPKIFLATEWSFQLPLEIDHIRFNLTGRIDWISHDIATGSIYVWDFKTSDTDYIHLDFVQIALYSFAIKKAMFLDVEPALVYFAEDKVKILKFDREKIASFTPIFHSFLLQMRKWYLGEAVPPQTVDRLLCGTCNLSRDCLQKFGPISAAPPEDQITPEQIPPPLTPELPRVPAKVPEQSNVLIPGPEQALDQITPPRDARANLGSTSNKEPFLLPLKNLLRHTAIIGSTGSGKTVLGKVLIEEALKAHYSALLIDPQGDLCSLIIPNDAEWTTFLQQIHYKIFTPGSEKGIKLSLNPLEPPAPSLLTDSEYLTMLLDNVASIILMILGYPSKKTTPNEKAILESIIREFWLAHQPLTFNALANAIEDHDTISSLVDGQSVPLNALISDFKKRELVQNLMKLGTGTEGLFFIGKERLNIPELVDTNSSLAIVNLASVGTDVTKRQLVISWILRQLYDWMLQNPQLSQDRIRLLLYIDEIADFLPPHPHDPPSKKMLTLILRQARKYGIACILATQSPATIDYKALDNVSTFFIGKTPSEQSYKKILDLVEPYFSKTPSDVAQKMLTTIRTAEPGNFLVITSEAAPQSICVRSLHSKHQTLSLTQIQQLQSPKNK